MSVCFYRVSAVEERTHNFERMSITSIREKFNKKIQENISNLEKINFNQVQTDKRFAKLFQELFHDEKSSNRELIAEEIKNSMKSDIFKDYAENLSRKK